MRSLAISNMNNSCFISFTSIRRFLESDVFLLKSAQYNWRLGGEYFVKTRYFTYTILIT